MPAILLACASIASSPITQSCATGCCFGMICNCKVRVIKRPPSGPPPPPSVAYAECVSEGKFYQKVA